MSVTNFPLWRENCTPAEKLAEILQYAESRPEDVKHLIVAWVDSDGDLMWAHSGGQLNYQSIGMLELTKLKMAGLHKHEDDDE